MKKIITISILIFLCVTKVSAQQMTVTGSGLSYSKGNINTEVLLDIIQQKQEEIKIHVLKNLIVNAFDNAKIGKDLKNFTTYYFIYNLVNAIITGKNKTAITQDLISSSTEFALVFGFAEYYESQKGNSDNFTKSQIKVSKASINFKAPGEGVKNTKNNIKNDSLNVELDMAYDILLNDPNFKKIYKFKEDTTNKNFCDWYENFNTVYTTNSNNQFVINEKYIGLQSEMKDKVNAYTKIAANADTLLALAKKIKNDAYHLNNITVNEYNFVRDILLKFIERARSEFPKNIVSEILSIVVDNTLVDFDNNTAKNLHIDVEAVISSIFDKYGSNSDGPSNTGTLWFLCPRPFFSMGANTALFINKNNNLTTDSAGNASYLNSFYFASEKIGFKFMLFDRKYLRSFKPGETFKYHGREHLAWTKPQKEAIISDAHIMVYTSGLLYNIVDVKSDKNFNYGLLGVSFGLTFFNGLNMNIGYGIPFTGLLELQNTRFFNIGMDIPIFDYISALASKK